MIPAMIGKSAPASLSALSTNFTNSSRSRFILNNFDEEIKYFVKVLPIDFKKAIENKKLENSKEGKDVLWEK